MSVCSKSCVLSGTGLRVGLITRPEESYRMCDVSEYDREASTMSGPWPTRGCCAMEKTKSKNLKPLRPGQYLEIKPQRQRMVKTSQIHK
jgi:hypothetical protein